MDLIIEKLKYLSRFETRTRESPLLLAESIKFSK